MSHRRRRRSAGRSLISFLVTWLILSVFVPRLRLWGLLAASGIAGVVAYFFGRAAGKKEAAPQQTAPRQAAPPQERARRTSDTVKAEPPRSTSQRVQPKVKEENYSPEVQSIIDETKRAHIELLRLYSSIQDSAVREKINEIARITDKFKEDAINDPADIPQIKKFMNYYLPTTIKLLNSYDRMSSIGIEGENLDKSMKNINDMLDAAIVAYKKRLDSLFADQALDIETDIDVMNQMLARDGLTENKDFVVQESGRV